MCRGVGSIAGNMAGPTTTLRLHPRKQEARSTKSLDDDEKSESPDAEILKEDHLECDRQKRSPTRDRASSWKCKTPTPHWGWMVVLASFLSHFIFAGFALSYGVYFIEWKWYFDSSSTSEISWIGSILMGTVGVTGSIGAILSERFGDRPVVIAGAVISSMSLLASAYISNVYALMVTFGFITGFGFSLIMISMTAAPLYYFKKKQAGLAVGIAVSGSGVGIFVMPLVIEYLIEAYGWRGSLVICSGLVLNCCVCGALLYPKVTNKAKQKRNLFNLSVFKNPSVPLLILVGLACANGFSVAYVHIAALVEQKTGVTRTQSAAVLSAIGGSNFLARIITGAIAGLESVNIFTLFGVALLIDSATLFIFPHFGSYPMSIVLALIFGFFEAPYYSVVPQLIRQVVGMNNLKTVFGLFWFMSGIGWITGAPIAGVLYDLTGNYDTSLYFGGAAVMVCILFYIKIWADGTCKRRQSPEPLSVIIEDSS